MHEALGAATPRLLGHLRQGCLWPAVFAIGVSAVFGEFISKPNEGLVGGFQRIGQWELGSWVLVAVATLLVAQLLDALYPPVHRLLTGRLHEENGVSQPAPPLGPSLGTISTDPSLAEKELSDARRQRRRKHYRAVSPSRQRSTRYGCALEAFLEGPHNFRFDVSGVELQLIAAERSNGEDPLGVLYARATAQVLFSFVSALAVLGALPIASKAGWPAAAVWFVSFTFLCCFSYGASVETITQLSKVGDRLFYLHRLALLERLSPYCEIPKSIEAEEKVWDLRSETETDELDEEQPSHQSSSGLAGL